MFSHDLNIIGELYVYNISILMLGRFESIQLLESELWLRVEVLAYKDLVPMSTTIFYRLEYCFPVIRYEVALSPWLAILYLTVPRERILSTSTFIHELTITPLEHA